MEEIIRRPDISEQMRWKVLKRDHYRCRYCGKDTGPFHMDHVYPFVKGGETTYKNLVTACDKCNMKKHATVGMWPLPVGYFDEQERLTPNFKLGLVILTGVISLSNASYFANEGYFLVGVIFFAFGLIASLWGAGRVMLGGYHEEI